MTTKCDSVIRAIVTIASLICCAAEIKIPPGTSSLAIVFDTTGSMNDDLIQVQDGAKKILETILNQRGKLIFNYIYVPFHDPGVGPVFSTTDSRAFQRHLNSVHVVGGGDCPEMVLSGIQMALEASLPSSFIYVFTDSRAKDYHLEDQLINLIQDKQSSVVFVMTGDCNNRTHPGFTVFEKVAAASFGQVFHLEKSDVNKVLNYVRYSISMKKVHILYEVRTKGGSRIKQIPVDSHLTELTISLSGEKYADDPLDISIIDPRGANVIGSQISDETIVIDLQNLKLLRIKDPAPGVWKVRTSSRYKNTLRVMGHGTIDFKYGFASQRAARINETYPRPIGQQSSYLVINMTSLMPPGSTDEVSLVDYHGKELYKSPAVYHKENPNIYTVGPFLPPKGLFFVCVNGVDDTGARFQRIAHTAVNFVQAVGPRAYMAERTIATLSQPINLTCSVSSRTEFKVYWYKDNITIAGPLFYPYSDSVVWPINDVAPYDHGVYRCEVVSEYGNHSVSTQLEAIEAVPDIFALHNKSVAIGSDSYLHCRTQSPHTVIEWMHNNAIIKNSRKMTVFPNGTLIVRSTDAQDAGAYQCTVKSRGGESTVMAFLDVLRPVKATVSPKSQFFAKGHSFNISCKTTGDPSLHFAWLFQNRQLVADHQKYYITHKFDLIVLHATEADAGTYECSARNAAGTHTDSSVAIFASAPTVRTIEHEKFVKRGGSVTVECSVKGGIPLPKVNWYRNGYLVSSHNGRKIDGSSLNIENVQESDSGQYVCIARNIAGRDSAKINLEVGSESTLVPTIGTMWANFGFPVTLRCRAIGHPLPTITWKRGESEIGKLDDRISQLADGSLLIESASIDDEGNYTCTAVNMFGSEARTTSLIITGLITPVLGNVPTNEQLLVGQSLKLSCVVVYGSPKPSLQWFKDGAPIQSSETVKIEGGGSLLVISYGAEADEGKYTCLATSPAGNASVDINVVLIKKPEVQQLDGQKYSVLAGQHLDIPCLFSGTPAPTVIWKYKGRQLSFGQTSGYSILPNNTLRIHHANLDNAGQYTCIASNAAGSSDVSVLLEVFSPPSIAPGQSSYNLIHGSPLMLACNVIGEPTPLFTWYLNDQVFVDGRRDSNGNLYVDEVDESHRGNFKCVAENSLGRVERIITVTVHTVPSIEGSGQLRTVVANVNETAVLPCPARAIPPPVRVWSYEDERIYPEYRHEQDMRITDEGSLQIFPAKMIHAGRYTCHVSNLAGDDRIIYLLKIQKPPIIISDVPGTIDIVAGLTLEIPCHAIGTPDPEVTWERNGLQVIPDNTYKIDQTGILRIDSVQLTNSGIYRCLATNSAGSTFRDTTLIIQEVPVILPETLSDYTAVVDDRIEMRCLAYGYPRPQIVWLRRGVEISTNAPEIHVTEDGTLAIGNVEKEDSGHYICRAINMVGGDEKIIRLNVIVPPKIAAPDIIGLHSVSVGEPFSLYCPIISDSQPQISWQLEDVTLAEINHNTAFSDDKRRIYILKARIIDAGSYRCIARNPAGEASKEFYVEVLVPPYIDEAIHKHKLLVLENKPIRIVCPVYGNPPPEILWLVNGQLLKNRIGKRNSVLSADGKEVIISAAQLSDESTYTCVASNKAGSIDIDVEISVLAPPKVGGNEEIEVVAGKGLGLNCEVQHEQQRDKPTITWLVNGSQTRPENSQIVLDGRRLYLDEVTLGNQGDYLCLVRNKAGESRKNFKISVLAPPQFIENDFIGDMQVNSGTTVTLKCLVSGIPNPTVKWMRDGDILSKEEVSLSRDNQQLTVQHGNFASHQYSCVASNSVGIISREFNIQVVAPPQMSSKDIALNAIEGNSLTMECPVVAPIGSVDITWLKDGKPLKIDGVNMQLSHDQRKLVMLDVDEENEATYTCWARNSAGEASGDFSVNVFTPPEIFGKLVEDIVGYEGESIELDCDFTADPIPEMKWLRDGVEISVAKGNSLLLMNEKRTVLMQRVGATNSGNYQCIVENEVGRAEKVFNVRIVTKPEIVGSNVTSTVEFMMGDPATIECPIIGPTGVNVTWLKNQIPIAQGTENIQILSNGRHLLVLSLSQNDEGLYTCAAHNQAGQAYKFFRLVALVPPSIVETVVHHHVIENNSMILPCEVGGFPVPTISWTKDGDDIKDLRTVFPMSGGQHLKIVHAEKQHEGSYICTVRNKVGKAEANFDVKVIARPRFESEDREIVEVAAGEMAVFRCPISEARYVGEIIWLKNNQPIGMDPKKYSRSQSDRKLHVMKVEVLDEGIYSCVVRNDAGENRIDYKLMFIEPPQMKVLDKDKNRAVIEGQPIVLSCPVTGKPEPNIVWMKDGQILTHENISESILSARLEQNALIVSKVEVSNSGRYTCEAKNSAGLAEQDIALYVMTKPRIEREGIPSEVSGELRSAATLNCPAYGRPIPNITWLKAGRPLQASSSSKIYLSANGMKIHFIDLKQDDANQYTCVARNGAGEDKRDFLLKFLEAPKIERPSSLSRIETNVERTLVINCPAFGSPLPKIAWLKNGQPLTLSDRISLLDEDRMLQIVNASIEDSARYICIATNEVGAADLEIDLEVYGSPILAGNETEIVETTANEPIDLVCEVNNADEVSILWLRNGQRIDFDSVHGNNYLQVSSHARRLHILSVKVSDTGRYTCVARNRAGEARKNFDLKVFVSPTISDVTSSAALRIIVPGTSFEINCMVDSIPSANIEWKQNDRRISPHENIAFLNHNQTIRIHVANDELQGIYTCLTSNIVGEASKDFIITLSAPPTLDPSAVVMDVLVGDVMILPCKVISGSVTAPVEWTFNGIPIYDGQVSQTVNVNEQRVEIRDARLSDSGVYTCTVKNKAGRAQKRFDVAVLEPPRFMDITNLKPSIIVGRPLFLDCSVTGTPKPNITWTKDGGEINNTDAIYTNDHQHLHIESAEETDAGRYTCIADNKPGRVEKDMIVDVQKQPKMEEYDRVFESLENQTITLVCPIKDSTVNLQWYRNNTPIIISKRLQLSASGSKLHLMNNQVSDTGRYTCHAWNVAGEDRSNMDVLVLAPPKVFGPAQQSIDALLNQTIEIDCKTSGIPQPEVKWSFNGLTLYPFERIKMLNNGTKLVLYGIETSQEGRYSCISSNKVGRAELDIFLYITVPPMITIKSNQIKVIEGKEVTIACETIGSPLPKLEWRKNGHSINFSSADRSLSSHSVHIREARVEDAGQYTCIATNRGGESRATIQLDVLLPPVIAEGNRLLQVKETSTISVDCRARGNPSPQIVWKRDGIPIKSLGSQLYIKSSHISDAGRYKCEARNEAGMTSADFEIDVFTKPFFKDLKSHIKIPEGERGRLECKVDGHPEPSITWLRGGRSVEDISNFILSPRGETLMILKAARSDAGSYSCVAKNYAGETDASFSVAILVRPYISEAIDQNPKFILDDDVLLPCPVHGYPRPKVEWQSNGTTVSGDRFIIMSDGSLKISTSKAADSGRYSCTAENEVGVLNTEFVLEIIGLPKFQRIGDAIYEVIEHEPITMDCAVEARSMPEVIWYRNQAPLYLTDKIKISEDGQQVTIMGAQKSDGGKYTCKAKNEAGSVHIDLHLKVLVPPSIDRSNIVENPLAIAGKSIYLECPVVGIPQPQVTWYKDGIQISATDETFRLDQGNQTLSINNVGVESASRYQCIAENKGGVTEQKFLLEVLTPPQLETIETEENVRHLGESLTLWCPVKFSPQKPPEIFWYKDNTPIDSRASANIMITSGGQRLQLLKTTLADIGLYSCVALNRAGEASLEFIVKILSKPEIEIPPNSFHPHVDIGNPVSIWCKAHGYPKPTIKWIRNDEIQEEAEQENIRILSDGEGLEILQTRAHHAGLWICEATNDAGTSQSEITLDVWIAPTVSLSLDTPLRLVNTPLTLYCEVTGNPLPSISWTKDRKPLISSAEGARISLKGRRIDIPRFSDRDVGEYACIAVNEAGRAEEVVHVDILVPPEIKRDSVDMSPRLSSSQSLTILCEATGKPRPTLQWYVNDTLLIGNASKVIVGNGGRYVQINGVSVSDKGIYKCVASSNAGQDELLYSVSIIQAPWIANRGTVRVVVGETASLGCDAHGEPQPSITWQRNGVSIQSGIRYITELAKLKIYQTRITDSGIYVCIANSEAGTAQQAYTLEVLVAPSIVSTPPTDSIVPVGQPFSLKCAALGYPSPQINWRVNDTIVGVKTPRFSVAEDGTLFAEGATQTSTLKLTCVAMNDAGKNELEYYVNFIGPPLVVEKEVKMINVTEGDPALLACEVMGSTTEIHWYKDGVLFVVKSNMELNNERSQLRMAATRLSDEGVYKCVATNRAGTATQTILLFVGVPPRITEKPRRVVINHGEVAELSCEAVGIPKPRILWLKDDQALQQSVEDELKSDPRKTAMIFSNVSSEDAGIYTCKAENWAGTSYKDVDLIVLIPPTVEPEQMNVTAELFNMAVLHCETTGIPEPVVAWIKLPNVDIISDEKKYQLNGNSLAIRNVAPDDGGFYQCVARSNAGQAIGSRQLIVPVQKTSPKLIWVECDSNGIPVKVTYMPARGDMPETHNNLLPWNYEYQDLPANGTDGVYIRCLPGTRERRHIKSDAAQNFLTAPKVHAISLGSVHDLICSASGSPIPTIYWRRNGETLAEGKSLNGASRIRIDFHTAVEDYKCIAENVMGVMTVYMKDDADDDLL